MLYHIQLYLTETERQNQVHLMEITPRVLHWVLSKRMEMVLLGNTSLKIGHTIFLMPLGQEFIPHIQAL